MRLKDLGRIRWWPLALLAAMWANLNTGQWHFEDPRGLSGWLLAARAALPYAVLPAALLTLLFNKRRGGGPQGGASDWLLLYGAIAAIATAASYEPYYSHYWSVTFLSGLLVCRLYVLEAPGWEGGRQLVNVTWAVCLAGAVTLVSMAPDAVLSAVGSGYGISVDLKEASRASGVARWAAVPGLVFLSRAIHGRRPLQKAIYLALSGMGLWVVYRMQSRGAVFAVLGALGMLLVCSPKARRGFGALLLLGAVVATIYGAIGGFGERFLEYLYRGQDREEFRSMTGRTRAYEHSLEEMATAPLLGRGQWNDRLSPLVGEHSHNSFIQAGLNAGALGFVPYVLSWIVGWRVWWKLWQRRRILSAADQGLVLECGLVIGFFTMRAMPETTTASFSVDSVVVAACYCYLESIRTAVHGVRVRVSRNARACYGCAESGQGWGGNAATA